MKKYVYMFSEGNEMMRDLLGGKGANLAAMVNLGLPVPQGFTVTTEACNEYYADGQIINDEMKKQIDECLERLEKLAGKKLGDMENPLLVSVRSGARASMPTVTPNTASGTIFTKPGPSTSAASTSSETCHDKARRNDRA